MFKFTIVSVINVSEKTEILLNFFNVRLQKSFLLGIKILSINDFSQIRFLKVIVAVFIIKISSLG